MTEATSQQSNVVIGVAYVSLPKDKVNGSFNVKGIAIRSGL